MHPSCARSFACLWWLSLPFSLHAQEAPAAAPKVAVAPTLRVFLLAGQSNMEGQAVVDLDHAEHYNGGRGTLAQVVQAAGQKASATETASTTENGSKTKSRYQHLLDADGNWAVRRDVVVWYRAGGERLKVGELSLGYAVYEGRHHFGPELQFGHVLGARMEEPVLLIKTAWGGKSLAVDFRPPSAGGTTGAYYQRMLSEYREAIAGITKNFPQFAQHQPQLSGFVWFQGWNDMVDADATLHYAENLEHLIRDVRRDLGVAKLPVVVAETGNADSVVFRTAQLRGTEHPDFVGNVTFVPTRQFLRLPEDSPNVGHGHHWFGNAESYFLIGDAMGVAMLQLLR